MRSGGNGMWGRGPAQRKNNKNKKNKKYIYLKKDGGLCKSVYFWILLCYALNLYVILTRVFILKTHLCLYTYSNFINDIPVLYSVQIRHI